MRFSAAALLFAGLLLSAAEFSPGPIPGTGNGSVGAGFGGVVTLKFTQRIQNE